MIPITCIDELPIFDSPCSVPRLVGMQKHEIASQGIRCLLQLAGRGPVGASAIELARAEGLAAEGLAPVLDALEARGFVAGDEAGCYRLSRPAEEIRLGAAWTALGGRGGLGGTRRGVTIAHLLELESRAFAGDSVAHAA